MCVASLMSRMEPGSTNNPTTRVNTIKTADEDGLVDRRCNSILELRYRDALSSRRCRSWDGQGFSPTINSYKDCLYKTEPHDAYLCSYTEPTISQNDKDEFLRDQELTDVRHYGLNSPAIVNRVDESNKRRIAVEDKWAGDKTMKQSFDNVTSWDSRPSSFYYLPMTELSSGSGFRPTKSCRDLNYFDMETSCASRAYNSQSRIEDEETVKRIKVDDFGRIPDHPRTSSFTSQNEAGFWRNHRDAFHSSYPLLRENISLLEKLRRERDACRQLENDMRDLEGQIQDVTKSFCISDADNTLISETEENITDRDGFQFELVYDSDEGAHREDTQLEGSFELEVSPEDELRYESSPDPQHSCLRTGRRSSSSFPSRHDLTLFESILSDLSALAEKLEGAIRERDREMLQLKGELFRRGFAPGTTNSLPSQWLRSRRSRELSNLPKELNDRILELQQALKFIFSREDRCSPGGCPEEGGYGSSSPASFTFESSPRVFVPTTRTIFSPVGDSVEMRSVVEPSSTPSSGSSRPPSPLTQQTLDEVEESFQSGGELSTEASLSSDSVSLDPPRKEETTSLVAAPRRLDEENTELCTDKEQLVSSHVIKRIELLQELVRPELCDSLTQRTLRIQKAKQEFLLGIKCEDAAEETTHFNSILVEEISLPNELTVKAESPASEEKKCKVLAFLRKKKREGTGDEPTRDSLLLDDWLRNPFRPKGKYKISNK